MSPSIFDEILSGLAAGEVVPYVARIGGTERMVLADIIHDAAEPPGWLPSPNPTAKERRFREKKGLIVVEADGPDLLAHAVADAA